MTKSNDELKACPFCPDGGNPSLANDVPDSEVGGHPDSWLVYCQKCGCSFEHEDTIANAIKKWNTRPTVTPTDGDAERQGALAQFNYLMKMIEDAQDVGLNDRQRYEIFLRAIQLSKNGVSKTIRAALHSTRKTPTNSVEVSAYEVSRLLYGNNEDAHTLTWLDLEEAVVRLMDKYPDGLKIRRST